MDRIFAFETALSLLLLIPICAAQIEPPPAPERPPAAAWTEWLGAPGSAQVRARLPDQFANAAQRAVAVEVEVQDVWLNYPAANTGSGIQQGVLRYQLDECPPVITTETRLRYAELSRGSHTVTVVVLGTDDHPVTPYARLKLKIP